MDVHAVAWVHRGPAVNDRALHLDALQVWPVPRGPAPLRARWARKVSVHLCRGPLHPLAGDAQQTPPGKRWHRHLQRGSNPVTVEEAYQEMLCTEDRPML
jgi:hypothetical protein